MTGKIIKGIAGFYYVHVADNLVYECKAKGVFRNRNEKPLVGDLVEVEVIDEESMTGNITAIRPRMNRLVRPEVANVDQALVVFAAANPEPNLHLLDCFLVRMMYEDVPVVICFNKDDLVDDNVLQRYLDIYSRSGCKVMTINTLEDNSKEKLMNILRGKTTVLAGPSGVGKSSIMNMLYPNARAQTGDISLKLGRGKHTTRHSEIFCIENNCYLMDTPGFSSLHPPVMECTMLDEYFPEMHEEAAFCRFLSCVHKDEPGCSVKQGVQDGRIAEERYDSYLYMLEELKQQKKW